MRSPRQTKTSPLSKVIFVLVFLLACWARAEEASPVPEGGEAGVENNKKPLEGEDTREWRDDEGRIQKLKGQLEKSKGEIDELFAAKSQATSAAEVVTLSKEISLKSDAMKKDYEEFRKLQLHIRFKHPEKGNFSARKYQREETLAPEEDHFDLSLQGKLDKVKSNFATHYSVVHKKPIEPKDTEAERKPAAVQDSKRIVLAK